MDRRKANLLVLSGEVFCFCLARLYAQGTGICFSGKDQYLFFRSTAVFIIYHQLMFIMCVCFYLVLDWVGYLGRYQ